MMVNSPMLFDVLPTIQILKLAFKILGYSKWAIIDDRIHQTFSYKALREDISLCPFYICDYTFSSGKYINDQEQVEFGRAVFIDLFPFLNGNEPRFGRPHADSSKNTILK